jgi:hypothetical protein
MSRLRSNNQAMQSDTPGTAFAKALSTKDFDRVRGLLDPGLSFRAATPNRSWEAASADDFVDRVLPLWFEAEDEIRSVEQIESESFADRERVGYRFAVTNPEGRFLVGQQAFIGLGPDGRINWLRIVCSGFRPV